MIYNNLKVLGINQYNDTLQAFRELHTCAAKHECTRKGVPEPMLPILFPL